MEIIVSDGGFGARVNSSNSNVSRVDMMVDRHKE